MVSAKISAIPRRTASRFRLTLRQAAGGFVLLMCVGACQEVAWRGTAVTPPRAVASFTFVKPDGQSFSTAPKSGQPTFLLFGYTNCPDVCPTTLADFARVRKALGKDANQVRFLFVTVDPERDSPAVAQKFAAQFDSTFIGLSGDSATTAGVLQAFGAAAAREAMASPSHYLMAHSSQTYLLDDQGRIVATYAYGAGWDAMSEDVRRLLH